MLTKLDRFLVLLDRWNEPEGHALAARIRQAGGKSAQASVLESALRMRHPWIRANAAAILGLICERSSVDALIGALDDVEADTRVGAARSLAMIGDRRATAALLGALRDEEWEVRREVVTALGLLRDPDALAALGEAATDPSWPVRQAVARSLGAVGGEDAFGAIYRLAQDQQTEVRLAAIDQIPRLGPQLAVELTQLALKDRVGRVRQLAISALSQVKSQAAFPVMLQLVDDADPSVRLTAVAEVCRRADPALLPVFQRLLKSPSEQVREAVCGALGNLRGREAILMLVGALDDTEPSVRLAAADALMNCAYGSKDPALRLALPVLRRLDGDQRRPFAQRRSRELTRYRETMHFIEYVTRDGSKLPQVSEDAHSASDSLPVPSAEAVAGS